MEIQPSSTFHTRPEFWELFSADLKRCNNSLTIVSAYITSSGVQQISKDLEDVRARNVKVEVFSRLPEEHTDPEDCVSAAVELRKLGVVVKRRPKLHAKVIVIDDVISYEGSLNPLTYVKESTTDYNHMRRIEHDDAGMILRKIGIIEPTI